jgi:hypothetical protein
LIQRLREDSRDPQMRANSRLSLLCDGCAWSIIRMQDESFDVCRAEMEHARFMVIDPNDGMIAMLAHGVGPFLAIFGT